MKLLSAIDLTNGEFGMLVRVVDFLEFMHQEKMRSLPSNDALEELLVRYIKQVRKEQMRYVSKLRVKRGQSPLPRKLTK